MATRRKEAAKKLVDLFRGETSHNNESQVSEWLQANAENQKELETTAELLALADSLADSCENDPELSAVIFKSRGRSRSPRSFYAIAASILLCVGVLLGVLWTTETGFWQPEVTRYVTRAGEQKSLTLADGSRITLNTSTKILTEFSDRRRRIILDYGEAYFDIASDPNRPFSVDLGSLAVTVLGTQFNVQKVRGGFTVAVAEGEVSLHTKSESIFSDSYSANGKKDDNYHLLAGYVATVPDLRTGAVTLIKGVDIGQLSSWRTGTVRFDLQPLYKVVQEINRYSKEKIFIEDATIMNLQVSAVLRVNEPEKALQALELSLPITVNRYYDTAVIVGEKTSD